MPRKLLPEGDYFVALLSGCCKTQRASRFMLVTSSKPHLSCTVVHRLSPLPNSKERLATRRLADGQRATHTQPLGAMSEKEAHRDDAGPTVQQQFMGGLFYAVSSFAIMFANKFVLTTFQFPSFLFLALSQFVATLILLQGGKMLGLLSYPDFDTYGFGVVVVAVAPLSASGTHCRS